MTEKEFRLRRLRFIFEEIATRARSTPDDTEFPHIDPLALEAERLAYELGFRAPPLQPVWYQRTPEDAPAQIEYDPENPDYDALIAEAVREP